MLSEIAAIVAPVFLLAGVGFVWVKRGVVYETGFVTRMALEIGTPCLIFSVLIRTEIDPSAFQDLVVAAFALYAVLGIAAFALLRFIGLPMRTYLSPFIFSNSGNMGLPLCLFAFGSEGLALAIVIFSTMVVANFSIGVWIVSGKPAPWDALKQPMVYAALLGALFMAKGWGVPLWLGNTLELAGQMVIPLMLITLGASIANLPAEAPWRIVALSAAKIGISGLIALLLAQAFGLTGATLGVFIVQAIMPVPVTSYLLAARFDAQPEEVARFVMISTALSVLVIPPILALLV